MGRRLNERRPSTRLGGFLKGLTLASALGIAVLMAVFAMLPQPEPPAELAAQAEPADPAGSAGSAGEEAIAEVEAAEAGSPEPAAPVSEDAILAEIDAALAEGLPEAGSADDQVGTGSEGAEDPAIAEAEALEAERLSLLPPELPERDDGALTGSALDANAVGYEAGDAPLIALVIDTDVAEPLPADVLTALPLRATLAIRPGADGAEALGQAAAARQWEVIARLAVQQDQEDAPDGALSATMTPDEVEARTEAALAHLGPAVAATAAFGDAFGSDMTLRAAFYETLAKHGYGWVAPGESAEGAGIAQVLALEAAPETGAVAEALDRAARDAAADGRAAVTIPATREALAEAVAWMIRGGALGADLAPVSAVIRKGAG